MALSYKLVGSVEITTLFLITVFYGKNKKTEWLESGKLHTGLIFGMWEKGGARAEKEYIILYTIS